MLAQNLIKRGVKWVVGNGADINVWEDNWIFTKPASPATGSGAITHPHLKVSDLLKGGTSIWDEHKVRSLLQREEAKYVLNIRPSALNKPDTLIWCFSKNGEYSVKSGYHLQRQISDEQAHQQQQTMSPPSEEMKKCFRRLWKLNLPPKIKTFWWRALHNGLPVTKNMNIRGLRVDSTCQTCGEMEETIDHVLFHCRVSKEIWSMTPSLLQTQQIDRLNLLQVVDIMLNQVNVESRNILNFFVGWRIWKMRNKLIFEQKREHMVLVIQAALREYNQWKEAIDQNTMWHEEMNHPGSISETEHELMPSCPSYYCLVDASWKDPTECGGIGWSLFSKEGIQLIHGSSKIDSTNSSLEAEAIELLMAVRQMRILGYKEVIFMSDCKSIIDELHQQYAEQTIRRACITEANSMIQDIVEISKSMGFKFKHVPRSLISCVDVIAKSARVKRSNYVITWCL